MGSNPGAVKKKDNMEAPGSHDMGVNRRPLTSVRSSGSKHLLQEGFFSEGSLLSSSPMSFYQPSSAEMNLFIKNDHLLK